MKKFRDRLIRSWRYFTATALSVPIAIVIFNFLVLPASVMAKDFNVHSYGAIGDGSADDGPAIQKTIDAAIKDGNSDRVLIPRGNYMLGAESAKGNSQLLINQGHDLTIEGEDGTTLTSAAPQRHIFWIQNSSNVQIAHLALDRNPLLFSQAVVRTIDIAKKSVMLRIEPGYPQLDASLISTAKLLLVYVDPKSGTWGDHSAACAFYKPEDVSVCWPPTIIERHRSGPLDWEVTLNSLPQTNYIGKRAVVWSGSYKGRAFLIRDSQDIVVEDVDYYGGGGEGGFIVEHCKGEITFRHFTVGVPPHSDRLIAAVGGGMVFNNHAKLTLDHVNISHIWDDDLNMGANYARVYQQVSPDKLRVDGSRADFMKGDRLAIWDWGLKTQIGLVRITNINCPKGPIRTCVVGIDHSVRISKVGYQPTRSKGNDDDGIDRVIDLDGVGSLNVHDSIFQSLHARCLLIKASNSVAENNMCYDTVMAGFLIGPQFFWDEGPEVHDLTILNNRFVNVSGPNILITNGGSSNAPANESIKIEGNNFVNFGKYQHGVNVRSGSAVVLQKNDRVSLDENKFSSSYSSSSTIKVLPASDLMIK